MRGWGRPENLDHSQKGVWGESEAGVAPLHLGATQREKQTQTQAALGRRADAVGPPPMCVL